MECSKLQLLAANTACVIVPPFFVCCFLSIFKIQAGKEWKFSVVESVMQCKEKNILGQDILDSFQNILKQGPFWTPAKTRDVASLA